MLSILARGGVVFLEGLMAGFYKGVIVLLLILVAYLIYSRRK